jgi:hypothetical protein
MAAGYAKQMMLEIPRKDFGAAASPSRAMKVIMPAAFLVNWYILKTICANYLLISAIECRHCHHDRKGSGKYVPDIEMTGRENGDRV